MKLAEAWVAWTSTLRDDLPSIGNVFVGTKVHVVSKLNADEARSWVLIASGATDAWQAQALMMTCFHTLVVRDGISPQAAHKAFLVIDEYRHLISRDIEGADDGDED